ncbi:hypothetical protein [Eupransor demetentiae]|uniref:Uncharacterized protein n=1 Tax=Eupransor demetentiae TaxID=3109584 RepID=A0ABM9N763_9LACO|nr:hypothetical protein R54876_GBNLAHCA_01377 [Lactobacillaceae bacterium LMG 33000]
MPDGTYKLAYTITTTNDDSTDYQDAFDEVDADVSGDQVKVTFYFKNSGIYNIRTRTTDIELNGQDGDGMSIFDNTLSVTLSKEDFTKDISFVAAHDAVFHFRGNFDVSSFTNKDNGETINVPK